MTDLHGDVESKNVVGCVSCHVGMTAVEAARSCGISWQRVGDPCVVSSRI